MMKRLAQSLILASSLYAGTAFAGIITINFDSGSFTVTDDLNVDLSGGTAADGDGFIVQLGYYDMATTGNNFLGDWVALSGLGSLNTGNITGSSINLNQTSIGDLFDNGAGTGTFALSLTYDENDATKNKSFPAVGTPLAVRFYNSTTLTPGVTKYNAFSIDSGFTWAAPADAPFQPVLNATLDDLGIEWQDSGNIRKTSLVLIPEPTSACLLLVGLAGLAFRRKRDRK